MTVVDAVMRMGDEELMQNPFECDAFVLQNVEPSLHETESSPCEAFSPQNAGSESV